MEAVGFYSLLGTAAPRAVSPGMTKETRVAFGVGPVWGSYVLWEVQVTVFLVTFSS